MDAWLAEPEGLYSPLEARPLIWWRQGDKKRAKSNLNVNNQLSYIRHIRQYHDWTHKKLLRMNHLPDSAKDGQGRKSIIK